MPTIVPALNCHRGADAEVRARLHALGNQVTRVHLDVCDGTFTPNMTWADPAVWPQYGAGIELDVHLLVSHPEQYIDAWLAAGATRIIVHLETLCVSEHVVAAAAPPDISRRIAQLREQCHRAGARFVLALAVESSYELARAYAAVADEFLVLAVQPGFSGQTLLPRAYDLIALLRDTAPRTPLMLDGGVMLEHVRPLVAAGVTTLVASHALFSATDPQAAYTALMHAV